MWRPVPAGANGASRWFNPFVHWAFHRFVHDQELACDAAVMAVHPGRQRNYAEALLNTALNPATPLVRTWSDAATLKERIRMLSQAPVTARARRSGLVIAMLLGLSTTITVWALQPSESSPIAPEQPLHLVDLSLTLHGAETGTRTMQVITGVGEWFSIADHTDGWQVDFRLQAANGAHYDIQGRLQQNGELIGEPRLVVETGVEAGVRVDGRYDLRLRIEPLSPDNDPRQADTSAALPAR